MVGQAVPSEQQEEPLTISLQADGTVSLQNTAIADDQLIERLRAIAAERTSDKLYLRADGKIAYERVVQVMGALNGAGFSNIVLVTDAGGPEFGGRAGN